MTGYTNVIQGGQDHLVDICEAGNADSAICTTALAFDQKLSTVTAE
jgi:hypothetical protein